MSRFSANEPWGQGARKARTSADRPLQAADPDEILIVVPAARQQIVQVYVPDGRRERVLDFAPDEYEELEGLRATTPVAIWRDTARRLWWFRDGYYWDDDNLSAEDVELLVWDRQRRQDARLGRLRTIRAREEEAGQARRERIPDEVRAFVWERDQGRCVRCGAEDELQFDHVIPVAKGGGSAIDNVQVLCADCNRQKSDSIV